MNRIEMFNLDFHEFTLFYTIAKLCKINCIVSSQVRNKSNVRELATTLLGIYNLFALVIQRPKVIFFSYGIPVSYHHSCCIVVTSELRPCILNQYESQRLTDLPT